MSFNITIPEQKILKPKISVFGVGGAGGNALNNMINSNLEGVEFISANTDSQSLQSSLASNRIQLGLSTTKGLGAGSFPDKGRLAAEENTDEINAYLEGNNMIFITAGMGGGTGTGAAPVIAKLSKEKDILTVAVVTKPFDFEGKYRMESALQGIEELKKYVDTLIIIPNQNLFRIANETTTFEEAFKMADNVLHAGVRGVTDLITMPGLVNLDFADIKTIMTKMGKAMMGTGESEGENRAVNACREAISNPLLDDISIKGAKGVLVNMTGGPDMTLFEADQAVNEIRAQVDENANIIFGSAFNENMRGKIRVSVVATGIGANEAIANYNFNTEKRKEVANDLTFFDPQDIQIIKNEPTEISSNDFQHKISLDNFIHNEQKINLSEISEETEEEYENYENNYETTEDQEEENVSYENTENYQDVPKTFETVTSHNFTPEESLKTEDLKTEENPENIYQEKYKDEEEDDSNGFSLFRFITGGRKNKKAQNDGDLPAEAHEPVNQQASLDFSYYDQQEQSNNSQQEEKNQIDSDDDVLNIPTFFRKKAGNE